MITSVDQELGLSGWTTKLKTTMIAAFNQDKYGKIDNLERIPKKKSTGFRLNERKEEKRKRLESRRDNQEAINQQDIRSMENNDQSLIYDTPTQEDGNFK